MDAWLSAITDVGFPAVVTLYLLNRIEKKLDMLNESIQSLPSQLTMERTEPGRSYK